MPFDYDKYQEKCNGMTTEQLQKEWENYTRQMSSGATSTATSILFMPVTGGFSAVGIGLSAPRIHNARKKREIIEAGLKARGTTHHTRTGDVLAPMAVSGIIGGLTLGLVPPGVDSVAGVAAGRGLEIAATNTALNATEAIVIDKAKKKAENETNAQSQAQSERYGTMATPFLIEESVMAFQQQQVVQQQVVQQQVVQQQVVQQQVVQQQVVQQQVFQQPAQPSSTTNGNEVTESVNQVSNTPVGETDAHLSKILQNGQESPAGPQVQTTHDKPQTTASDVALFASIPSHNLDLTDLLTVDEEHMLAMHALAVTMEKLETQNQSQDLAPGQLGPQPTTQGQTSQIEAPQSLPQSEPQALRSIEENQVHSDNPATPNVSYQPQEQRPTLPPRQAPHSATLPDRLYSPQTASSSSQDAQNYQYPPQPLPPYQPQYFSPTQQVAEPQQYYQTPPPMQQRHDSGYGSMYSTPSIGSSSPQTSYPPPSISSASPQTYYPPPSNSIALPQTYYPPPSQFVSRHSSIPQSYVPPPTSFNSSLMTAPHQQRHASESSFYPMTPPPPYYPPPPGMNAAPNTAAKENDYFNQNAVPPPPTQTNASFNPLLAQPQKLVDGMNKGWQWARANALPIKTSVDSKNIAEPNYGPPPSVPTAWRGS